MSALLSRSLWYKVSWIGGSLLALELVGLAVGSWLPWWLAIPLIGAAGALAAYTLDEHL